jgi:hypothetical protein
LLETHNKNTKGKKGSGSLYNVQIRKPGSAHSIR